MEKLIGTYVNIREVSGKYYLDYLDEDGQPSSVEMIYHRQPFMVTANQRDLSLEIEKSEQESDLQELKKIRKRVNCLKLLVTLPEIYAAHCAGNSPEEYFTKGGVKKQRTKGESQSKKNVNTQIDQDDLIDKFRTACKDRKLQKGKTIPAETLYEIAQEIGLKRSPRNMDEFKDGNKMYHLMYQYASLTGYKKKRKT